MSAWNKNGRRARLFEKQEGRCIYCGKPCQYMADQGAADLFTVDHIIPRSIGGGQAGRVNLVGACQTCNHDREDQPIIVFIRRRRAKRHHPGRLIPACLTLLDHCRGIGPEIQRAQPTRHAWPKLGELFTQIASS